MGKRKIQNITIIPGRGCLNYDEKINRGLCLKGSICFHFPSLSRVTAGYHPCTYLHVLFWSAHITWLLPFYIYKCFLNILLRDHPKVTAEIGATSLYSLYGPLITLSLSNCHIITFKLKQSFPHF